MKNKGFTLVELLATVSILALIIAIVVPAVSQYVADSRNKSYDDLEKKIITVAKRYVLKNSNYLPDDTNNKCINLSDLVEQNLFDTDKLIDPINNKELNGSITIEYNKDGEEYKYTFTKNTECE